jgi:beta-hydroxylase
MMFYIFVVAILLIFVNTEIDRYRIYGSKYFSKFSFIDYYEKKWVFATAILNNLIQFTSINNTAYLDTNLFKLNQTLESKYEIISTEYLNNYNVSKSANSTFPKLFGNIGKEKWNVIPLFWYGKLYHENIKKFPNTYDLLKSDNNIKSAMFSILEPGKYIKPHFGPFRGCLRYHLGIQIPKDKDQCYINVDNINYNWIQGKGVIFDDTYLHYVYNNTTESRCILFLDLVRPTSENIICKLIFNAVIASGLPRMLAETNNVMETTNDIN